MKNIKIFLQFILIVSVFTALSTVALADGGYGPYGPHNPVDTSIAGADTLSLFGIGFYGVGSIIVTYASKLKSLLGR